MERKLTTFVDTASAQGLAGTPRKPVQWEKAHQQDPRRSLYLAKAIEVVLPAGLFDDPTVAAMVASGLELQSSAADVSFFPAAAAVGAPSRKSPVLESGILMSSWNLSRSAVSAGEGGILCTGSSKSVVTTDF